ncbi:hypothetical protein U9M48_008469 [Paspalum notatum var. saurae]|uniref:Uncharacterized protein n=1 Tax=Paspalum notatum var. saurae TaxID=547442 RepID=A0AAQ3SP04_PASNO
MAAARHSQLDPARGCVHKGPTLAAMRPGSERHGSARASLTLATAGRHGSARLPHACRRWAPWLYAPPSRSLAHGGVAPGAILPLAVARCYIFIFIFKTKKGASTSGRWRPSARSPAPAARCALVRPPRAGSRSSRKRGRCAAVQSRSAWALRLDTAGEAPAAAAVGPGLLAGWGSEPEVLLGGGAVAGVAAAAELCEAAHRRRHLNLRYLDISPSCWDCQITGHGLISMQSLAALATSCPYRYGDWPGSPIRECFICSSCFAFPSEADLLTTFREPLLHKERVLRKLVMIPMNSSTWYKITVLHADEGWESD